MKNICKLKIIIIKTNKVTANGIELNMTKTA